MAIITANSENDFTIEYEEGWKVCHISSKVELFSYFQSKLNLWDIREEFDIDFDTHQFRDWKFFQHFDEFYNYSMHFRMENNHKFDKDIPLELKIYLYELQKDGSKKYDNEWLDFTIKDVSLFLQNLKSSDTYRFCMFLINEREQLYYQVWDMELNFWNRSWFISHWPLYWLMKGKMTFSLKSFIEKIAIAFAPKNNEPTVWK